MSKYQNLEEIIQGWIHVMPKASVTKSFTNEDEAATCRANFIGENNSDPTAEGKEIYTDIKNLPTAIASIMNHNQLRANFHPSEEDPEMLFNSFKDYVREVDNCPFLHLTLHDSQKQSFESSDYNKLIDQIIKLYDGVSAENKDKMKDSIADLGKSVFSNSGSDVLKNLFSETTVFIGDENGEPTLYLFFTQLHMVYESPGAFKPDVNKQSYSVARAQYTILPELIKANADSLQKLNKKDVDDWLNDSTSPERKEAELCFKVEPYCS
jgi:hypothetical protein